MSIIINNSDNIFLDSFLANKLQNLESMLSYTSAPNSIPVSDNNGILDKDYIPYIEQQNEAIILNNSTTNVSLKVGEVGKYVISNSTQEIVNLSLNNGEIYYMLMIVKYANIPQGVNSKKYIKIYPNNQSYFRKFSQTTNEYTTINKQQNKSYNKSYFRMVYGKFITQAIIVNFPDNKVISGSQQFTQATCDNCRLNFQFTTDSKYTSQTQNTFGRITFPYNTSAVIYFKRLA